METLATRVRHLRKLKNWSQDQLAQACEKGQTTIQSVENGTVKNPRYIDKLAAALDTTEEWLLFGRGAQKRLPYEQPQRQGGGAGDTGYSAAPSGAAPEIEEDNTGVHEFIFGNGLKVPVYGVVLADNAETAVINDGNVIEYVPAHPHQRNLPGAFALRVPDDLMSPRYKEGELVYVHPRRPPGKGDDIVIDYLDGNAAVKSYLGQTQDKLRLRQYNPDKELEIEKRKIKAVYTVIGRG